ncbi:MAG: glycosyl hydrolase 115 family protein [Tepidisphaeraceae bacterium]|jgi:hypothetical protein
MAITIRPIHRVLVALMMCLLLHIGAGRAVAADASLQIIHAPVPGGFDLAGSSSAANVFVDSGDFKLANIAGGLLCDDVERVTGIKPSLAHDAAKLSSRAVLIGTLGHSPLIDQLAASGKIDARSVTGKWETYLIQIVDHPLPNVASALVIAGSDRRGTAYGVFDLSQAIGVSPWYWWADVTPVHQDTLVVQNALVEQGPPSVKYRGIFINDEDWGLEPWAAKTFEPEVGNIGPKTYTKVFELILRLRGNFLWPAMHPVSTEFGRIPANINLADDWGIVMGASHTEAMNRNNVLWPQEGTGEWRYDTNRTNVLAYWEQWAKLRGPYEAVWTEGIRGVHDSAMNGPKDMPSRVKIVETAIADQRDLLRKYVNADVTKVPQLFAPYKEVLAIYQAGLKVPDDVTLLWTDDNYGYIRQLSTPAEQQRAGASGIYYHISYLGHPRSYVWLNTTPPALIWEEMTKAYDYGANRVWVLNVGDIKPGEIGMEFWMRLGWSIHAYDRQNIPDFLNDWATRDFGPAEAPAIAKVMATYYRLGFAQKPEAMDTMSFNRDEAIQRLKEYDAVATEAQAINDRLPRDKRDAFFELVLYPVQICDWVNHAYLAPDRTEALKNISDATDKYNTAIAGGKWHEMMTEKGTTSTTWGYQWPTASRPPLDAAAPEGECFSVLAEHSTRKIARNGAQWQSITGLGRIGDSMAVFPTTTPSVADAAQLATQSPEMDYDFTATAAGDVQLTVYAIPTHRIDPGRGLRYAAAIDDETPTIEGFDQEAGDTNRAWSANVIHNAAITTTTHTISAVGKHTLKIFMVDPGVVLEKFVISSAPLPPSDLGPPETAAR